MREPVTMTSCSTGVSVPAAGAAAGGVCAPAPEAQQLAMSSAVARAIVDRSIPRAALIAAPLPFPVACLPRSFARAKSRALHVLVCDRKISEQKMPKAKM
jgi:hypothetical protein